MYPTSRPSDRNSYSYCVGPFSLTKAAWYRNVGSRCSIRTTPLWIPLARALTLLACRFRIHSPEKSCFSCATPKVATPRRIPVTINVRINIVHLTPFIHCRSAIVGEVMNCRGLESNLNREAFYVNLLALFHRHLFVPLTSGGLPWKLLGR